MNLPENAVAVQCAAILSPEGTVRQPPDNQLVATAAAVLSVFAACVVSRHGLTSHQLSDCCRQARKSRPALPAAAAVAGASLNCL